MDSSCQLLLWFVCFDISKLWIILGYLYIFSTDACTIIRVPTVMESQEKSWKNLWSWNKWKMSFKGILNESKVWFTIWLLYTSRVEEKLGYTVGWTLQVLLTRCLMCTPWSFQHITWHGCRFGAGGGGGGGGGYTPLLSGRRGWSMLFMQNVRWVEKSQI